MSDQTGAMLKAILTDKGVTEGVEKVLRAVMYAGANDLGKLTKELMQMGPESVSELGAAGGRLYAQADAILNGVAKGTSGPFQGTVRLLTLLPEDGPEHGVQVVDVLRAGVDDGGLAPGWQAPEDVEGHRDYRIGSTAETIFNLMTGHVPYSDQDRATLARQIATQLEDEGRLR